MSGMRQQFFLTILLFFFASVSQAQSNSKFTWGALLLFGTGETGNTSDVKSRGMIHMPASAFVGYNFKKFRLATGYEYNLIGQTADPADFSGQNISGKAGAATLRFEYYDGKQSFAGIYRLADTYTLDRPTLTGGTSVYEAKSGFGVQYYRQIRKKIGFVIDFSTGEYKSVNNLTADLKWNRISLGMIFTNFVNSR